LFFFLKRGNSKYVRVLAVCNTQKHFYIFLSKKTQTSQLIAIKDNKPCAYILKICNNTEQSKKFKDGPSKPDINFFCPFLKLNLAQPYGLDFISRLNPVTGSNQLPVLPAGDPTVTSELKFTCTVTCTVTE
jgi:hypothetical protein